MIVLTWAARVWGALFIATWAAIGALAVLDWWRGRRVIKRRDAIPGPGQPQASGVGSDDDTGVRAWTDEENAFLRGELKELPK